MSKIKKLTEDQEKDLVVTRNEWLGHGLSTEPADFDTAKEVITGFYKMIGHDAPAFVCLPSPDACLREFKRSSKSSAQDYLQNSFFGQQDSYWIAHYGFSEKIGVKFSEDNSQQLAEWARLAKSVGWWTPSEKVCYLSDRPTNVKFDNDNRLHCENSLAIEYRDGWGVAMWHGTRIPRDWVLDKKSLTASVALTWRNIEQRRAACELLGWINVLDELNAEVIDRDVDPQIGNLLRADIPHIGVVLFLRVECGTGRNFCLPVPPNMKTAVEAQAWTYGFEGNTIEEWTAPEIRT